MTRRLQWFAGVLPGSFMLGVLRLSHVLAAGATVLVAFGSQALGAGIIASFVTGTVGALVCALISRTPGEIVGPHVALSVVYATLGADLVLHGGPSMTLIDVIASLSLAVVLMGLMQIVAAWARLGAVVKFLPFPVNAGFVTGTGMLLIWSQLGALLGLDGRLSNYNWSALLESAKPWGLLIGVSVLLVVWAMPRFNKRVQPLLVGLILGTALYHVLKGFVESQAMSPMVGPVSILSGAQSNIGMAWSHRDLDWLLTTSMKVLPYSGFLALQGTMLAALGAVSVADVSGVRPDVNRVIRAQGVGNVLCGLLGALPLSSTLGPSVIAAKMREINSTVPAMSAALLLVAALFLEPLIALVPIVVLAATVIFSGVSLIDNWTRQMLARIVTQRDTDSKTFWNLVIVLAVTASLFFGNVPLALMVGAVLATTLLLVELSSSTKLNTQAGATLASRRVWPVNQLAQLEQDRASIRVFRPRGGLFFANADQLSEQLMALNDPVRYCVIDCSLVTVLDVTGCRIIAASAKKLAARGVTTALAGLDPTNRHGRGLIELGLDTPSPKDRWFRDLDHALEWIETELLRAHSPEVAANKPVALENAQLTEGLNPNELEALRPYLLVKELAAGERLFKRGAPGSSIYIINSGLIEIRVDADETAGGWVRMGVLGPGCLFGEIAMLTGGHRSADAVCAQPAQLFELSQESLHGLENKHPSIHSRILANLNKHLAMRVIAATEIARGQ